MRAGKSTVWLDSINIALSLKLLCLKCPSEVRAYSVQGMEGVGTEWPAKDPRVYFLVRVALAPSKAYAKGFLLTMLVRRDPSSPH